jgi:predicted transcriptional regulator
LKQWRFHKACPGVRYLLGIPLCNEFFFYLASHSEQMILSEIECEIFSGLHSSLFQRRRRISFQQKKLSFQVIHFLFVIIYNNIYYIIVIYKYIQTNFDIMVTTIQIKEDIKATLNQMKLFERETYNDVLERLIEDVQELNEKTRTEIESALREIESGKFVTHEKLAKELGF